MILPIVLGSWGLGAILFYLLSPLFPMGTLYVDAEDLRTDIPPGWLLIFSSMWPIVVALVLPFSGLYHLREWIRAARLRSLTKNGNVRIDLDEADDEDEDDWDEDDEDDDDDEEESEEELDYRTMSCHSCGHTVEKSE